MGATNYLDMIWNGEISEDNIRECDIILDGYKYITPKILSSAAEIAHISEGAKSFNWKLMAHSENDEIYSLKFKSPFISYDSKLCWIIFELCITLKRNKRREDEVKYLFNLYDTFTEEYRTIRPSMGIELYKNIIFANIKFHDVSVDILINSCNFHAYNKFLELCIQHYISQEDKWIKLNEKQCEDLFHLDKERKFIIDAKKYDICPLLRLYLVTWIINGFIPKSNTIVLVCTIKSVAKYYIYPEYCGFEKIIPESLNDGLCNKESVKYPLITYNDNLIFPYWNI